MGLIDKIKSIFAPQTQKETTLDFVRPVDLTITTRSTSDYAKVIFPIDLSLQDCDRFYNVSDLLRTIIRNIVFETFRNGLTVKPIFTKKCAICGTKYKTGVDDCEVCGGKSFIAPDKNEQAKIEEWMKDVNFNDQSLLEVLQELDSDLNLYDNAFLVVLKEYDFNANGDVIGARVVEVLRGTPHKISLVMSKNGRFGYSDDGRLVLFCLRHRNNVVFVDPKEYNTEKARCKICGAQLFPAYYKYSKTMPTESLHYTNGEILHIKKFTSGIGFGMSPVSTVALKLSILLNMDSFILSAYSLQRSPKGILLVKANPQQFEKAWSKLKQEAKENPHMIYPLAVEGSKDVKNIVEWVDLSFKPTDIDFIQYRDELRKAIGAVWGVAPVFMGDSGGQGLGNEGIQILVTNRTVKVEQQLFNEKVLPWLCKTAGFKDWIVQLVPNEGRDIIAKIQREQMRAQTARTMASLGYRPVAKMTEDGIDFDYYEEVSGTYQSIEEPPKQRMMSARRMPRFEGETQTGRPQEEQRYENEESGLRKPKTQVVGTIGEIFGDQGMEQRIQNTEGTDEQG